MLDGHEDGDRDRVDNANEDRERTHPRRPDSDRDGKGDGREDADRDGLDNHGEDVSGNDPIDSDTDDDGVEDGAEAAGEVESLVDGLLTVRTLHGPSVSGLVTTDTEIECESEEEHEGLWDDELELAGGPLGVAGRAADRRPGGDDDRSGSGYGDDDRSGPGNGPDDDGSDDDPSRDDDDDLDDDDRRHEPGDDSLGESGECGTDALVPGAVVHEAELELGADGAVFVKIELVS